MSSSKSSTEESGDESARDESVTLARLGRPKGLRGEIWLHVNTDRARSVLGPGTYVLQSGRSVRVEELKEQNGRWLWTIAGLSREEMAALVNDRIVVAARDLPPRPDGEYGEHEIIGLTVVDSDGRTRGRIARIDHRYEIDTWIVACGNGREGEIAAVAEFVKKVDLESGIVTVDSGAILEEE
ncbi:MAG: ribosome maturation factor RimM [Candidatus Hydrogenedentota bacterium]